MNSLLKILIKCYKITLKHSLHWKARPTTSKPLFLFCQLLFLHQNYMSSRWNYWAVLCLNVCVGAACFVSRLQSPIGSFLFPAFNTQGRIQAHPGNIYLSNLCRHAWHDGNRPLNYPVSLISEPSSLLLQCLLNKEALCYHFIPMFCLCRRVIK